MAPSGSSTTSVERFGTGASAADLRPGHLVFTHGRHWPARLIRFGQKLRFTGPRAPFAYWNHVALVLGPSGDLAEALSSGVVRTNIAKYERTDYDLVRVESTTEDEREILLFAESVLLARWRYGWVTILGLALTLLTGSRLTVGRVGTAICSGFAAEALVRNGTIFTRPPAYMMPADLAEHYGVRGRSRALEARPPG